MTDLSFYRGRRLRRTPEMRGLVAETRLDRRDLMMLYFVAETHQSDFCREISAMPGQYQLSLQMLERKVGEAVDAGLTSLMLFGLPQKKDAVGSEAYNPDGIVQQAVRLLKKAYPRLVVATDVCLCEYTDHGHCGMLAPNDLTGEVRNDPTLDLLAKMALSHVRAGADIVAPSDMMDGRIAAIRETLDGHGFHSSPILSYSVKYASAYYGPFREAADSAPSHGDRRTYQMDPPNYREALREASADVAEGADMLMVKPAGPYQDVIRLLRDNFDLPLAAYQVSGEYSMIRAAGLNGWINEEAVMMESLLGIKRAGADILITYFAEDVLKKGLIR